MSFCSKLLLCIIQKITATENNTNFQITLLASIFTCLRPCLCPDAGVMVWKVMSAQWTFVAKLIQLSHSKWNSVSLFYTLTFFMIWLIIKTNNKTNLIISLTSSPFIFLLLHILVISWLFNFLNFKIIWVASPSFYSSLPRLFCP